MSEILKHLSSCQIKKLHIHAISEKEMLYKQLYRIYQVVIFTQTTNKFQQEVSLNQEDMWKLLKIHKLTKFIFRS